MLGFASLTAWIFCLIKISSPKWWFDADGTPWYKVKKSHETNWVCKAHPVKKILLIDLFCSRKIPEQDRISTAMGTCKYNYKVGPY